MATKYNSVDLTKYEMGAVGADGAMGGSLTQYNGIKEGTCVLALEAPTTTDINIEESSTPFYAAPSGKVTEFTLTLLDLAMADLVNFLGGTFTAGVGGTNDTFEHPAATPTIIQSVQLTSANTEGDPIVRQFPRCQLFASESQTLTKTDAIGLDILVKVLQPIDASGDPITPYIIEGNEVT